MPDQRRYIVWKKPKDGPTDRVLAIARERAAKPPGMFETEDFAVAVLEEGEIRAAYGDAPETPLLPDDYVFRPHHYDGPEGFTGPGRFRLGLDVPLAVSDFAGRRNALPGPTSFDRRRAEALIGADAIRAFAATGGRRVNVAVVDGGLDRAYLARFGHAAPILVLQPLKAGFADPRRGAARRHGNAMGRGVLALARDARLIDIPALPQRIDVADAYASNLIKPLIDLWIRIVLAKALGQDQSWVIVCAWSILSRAYDRPLGTYVEDRGHNLSTMLGYLSQVGADIVFSAGNNGLFWPNLHAGRTDRGPRRSIMGSNGLPEVLTVGAVTPLGAWIGESSQGPEPAGLRRPADAARPRKPDVCAPSWFHETDDRHAVVTGTSGACAMAAGVVAAIRRRVSQTELPPAALIELIRATARREGYVGGHARANAAELRLGSGVIDGAALAGAL